MGYYWPHKDVGWVFWGAVDPIGSNLKRQGEVFGVQLATQGCGVRFLGCS